MPKKQRKKHYDRRMDKITVRACEDPSEYSRQYYWVVTKDKSKAPPKGKRGRKKRKKKK